MCLDTNESLSNYPRNDICQRMFALLNRKSLFILQHSASGYLHEEEWINDTKTFDSYINLEIIFLRYLNSNRTQMGF